jgi:tetratricopeptide (TPR) repeat protein
VPPPETHPAVQNTPEPVVPHEPPRTRPPAEPKADDARGRQADERRFATLRKSARDQIDGGNREEALAAATSALELKHDDKDMRAIVDRLLDDAVGRVASARTEALRAGAAASAQGQLDRAIEAQSDAENLANAGRLSEAIQGYWNAEALFSQASVAARRTLAEHKEQSPSKPSASPGTGTRANAAPSQNHPSAVPAPAATSEGLVAKLPAPDASVLKPPESTAKPTGTQATSSATPAGTAGRGDTTASPVAAARGKAATSENAAPSRDADTSSPTLSSFVNKVEADEAGVRQALRTYAAAYNRRDVGAVSRVYTSLSPAQLAGLEKTFGDATSYTMDTSNVIVWVDGSKATASGHVVTTYEAKGRHREVRKDTRTFRLERKGAAWVIVGVQQ